MKNLIKLYCVAAGGFALSLSFSLLTAQEATSLSGLLGSSRKMIGWQNQRST